MYICMRPWVRKLRFFSSYVPAACESLGASFIASLLSRHRHHFTSQCNDRLQSSRLSHYDEFGLIALGRWTAKQSDDDGATSAMFANKMRFCWRR